MSKGAIIIPARFGSTRFPGKPLHLLNGKPLIQHTWEVAMKAREIEPELDEVIIATDSLAIQTVAIEFGAKVCLVNRFCRNGSERVYEAGRQLDTAFTHLVNLQGDACLSDPMWPVLAYRKVRGKSLGHTDAVSTIALSASRDTITEMRARVDEGLPSGETTVVVDEVGRALYFSKAVLPHKAFSILQHVGIYAYTFPALRTYCQSPMSEAEAAEELEQLRFLHIGIAVDVVVVPGAEHRELNNPEDAPVIEGILKARGALYPQ